MTVRVFRGQADFWSGLEQVWIGNASLELGSFYDVQTTRAYRDRLVLKLEGVDDASAAAGLRGCRVAVSADRVPRPQAGEYHAALLVGLEVRDPEDRLIGRVSDVVPTAGADLLVIDASDDAGEILVPLVEDIVREVDEQRGTIRIRPPEGLLELNRDRRE